MGFKKKLLIIPIIIFFIFLINLRREDKIETPFEVVIDQSKEQVYSPFDMGYSGMSQFTGFLYRIGATVSLNFLPLNKFLESFKGKGKVLFLGVSMYQKYSEEEINSIKSFLETGGGVLAIVEHDNFFNNLEFQNPLIEIFGVKGMNGQALGNEKGWSGVIWPNCISSTLKLEDVHLYLAAPLDVQKPASTYLMVKNPHKKELDKVAAFSSYKEGRVVVIGDMEIFWNMAKNAGIRNKNNQQFLKGVFNYLKNNGVNQGLNPKFKFHAKPMGKILFYTGGGGLSPHGSPSGLSLFAQNLNNFGFDILVGEDLDNIKEFALVVIAVPVSPLEDNQKLLLAKRLLLISDGQTDFFAKEKERKKRILGHDLKLDLDFKEFENPLNFLLNSIDFEFYPGTLISSGENHFMVKGKMANGLDFEAKKAGVLVSKKTNNTGEKYFKFEKAYVLEEVVPNSPDKKDGTPFSKSLKNNNINDYSLMVATKKIMAISDLELLSNQFFDSNPTREILKKIYLWLNN